MRPQNSRWYSGAGLYREVTLLHSPALRVQPQSLRFTTCHLDPDGAAVELSARLENGHPYAQAVTAAVTLRDPQGQPVATRSFPLRLKAGETVSFRKQFYVNNALLWDEDHPALYTADPTRFTTNGVNGAFAAGDGLAEIVQDITGQAPGAGDVNVFMGAMANHMPEITRHRVVGDILERLEPTMDVLGYNYMTARYLPDAAAYPDRVMVGSETARHDRGYRKPVTTAAQGCALAILQRTGPGEITGSLCCGDPAAPPARGTFQVK